MGAIRMTQLLLQLMLVLLCVGQVEEMNARWQCYVEQREKYTRALEQRCSELEHSASPQHHHHHHGHHGQQQQQQQLSDALQRRVDQLLLDQRHKTELADQARIKVHTPYASVGPQTAL